MAADDFYLCEGFVYDLKEISGYLCTSTLDPLYKARLELYSDCNGKPSKLLYTFKNSRYDATDIYVDGYRLVKYTFVVDQQGIVRAADVDPDYTIRPEATATLATVQDL